MDEMGQVVVCGTCAAVVILLMPVYVCVKVGTGDGGDSAQAGVALPYSPLGG